MFTLPSRFSALRPAGTVRFLAAAAARKARGDAIISLAAAEPFTRIADEVSAAAISAITQGRTQYAGAEGTPELKQALRQKLQRDNGLSYEDSEIVVSNGTKPLMTAILLALTDAGAEVIIPSPYYNAYPELVTLAGARPVIVPCPQADGFLLTPAALQAALTPDTRAIFLSNPNNPAGAVYTRDEWLGLAKVLESRPDVYLIVDEIFEHWYFDRRPVSAASVTPLLKSRTLIVNGFSKGYSMNGWRLGFAAGPASVMRAVATIAAHVGGPPSPIAQTGGVAALSVQGHVRPSELAETRRVRDLVVARLRSIDGLDCHVPDATFVVFPSCTGIYGRVLPNGLSITSDESYALALLEYAGVAVAPGSGFGWPGHVRLSLAPGEAVVLEALDRIADFHATHLS